MMFRKDKVHVQVKTTTQTSLGETVVWKPVGAKWARVIPLTARERIVFMQNQSETTHRIHFKAGTVSITLGNNRINHGSKTYEPTGPTLTHGEDLSVEVKEI